MTHTYESLADLHRALNGARNDSDALAEGVRGLFPTPDADTHAWWGDASDLSAIADSLATHAATIRAQVLRLSGDAVSTPSPYARELAQRAADIRTGARAMGTVSGAPVGAVAGAWETARIVEGQLEAEVSA